MLQHQFTETERNVPPVNVRKPMRVRHSAHR